MQVEVSVTTTKTYKVNLADDTNFDADDITDTLFEAIDGDAAIDSHFGAIEVVNTEGTLIYSDSEG